MRGQKWKKKKKLGTDLNKIDFKYSEAIKLSEANTSFPKFQFFFEDKNVIIYKEYSMLFSLKWQPHFIFEIYLSNTQVWVPIH